MSSTRAPVVPLRYAYISRRLLIALLIGLSAPAVTYAQTGSSAQNGRDTLPDHVARRALEAYNRHDVTALATYFDTVSVHELLGDSAGRYKGAPVQMFGGMSDYLTKNKVSVELKQQIVSGRYVVQLYDFIENGKRTPHLEIYEIRHGKIVHDWDQGP
jgi:hypothetical protein